MTLCVTWPIGLVKYTYQQLGLCVSTGATYFAHFWTTTLTVESDLLTSSALAFLPNWGTLTHKQYTKGEKVMSWRFVLSSNRSSCYNWSSSSEATLWDFYSKPTQWTWSRQLEDNSHNWRQLIQNTQVVQVVLNSLWMVWNQFLWLSKFIWKWPTTCKRPTTIIIIIISAYLMLRQKENWYLWWIIR